MWLKISKHLSYWEKIRNTWRVRKNQKYMKSELVAGLEHQGTEGIPCLAQRMLAIFRVTWKTLYFSDDLNNSSQKCMLGLRRATWYSCISVLSWPFSALWVGVGGKVRIPRGGAHALLPQTHLSSGRSWRHPGPNPHGTPGKDEASEPSSLRPLMLLNCPWVRTSGTPPRARLRATDVLSAGTSL